jgi:uncharacterized protein
MTSFVPSPLSRSFFERARRGELTVQRCTSCGKAQLPPRPACTACMGEALELVPASGRATVRSFTTVHRAPTKELQKEAPYIIALVDLDEGPSMMTRIVGAPAGSVRIGMRVQARFEPLSDDVALVYFAPEG